MSAWQTVRRASLTLVPIAVLVATVRVAEADPSPPAATSTHPARARPPLRVDYAAPGNCPTQSDFEDRIRARTSLAHFEDAKDAQEVHVVVQPTGFTYAGHLSLAGHNGAISQRDVEDTLCSDVVDALALVTALAIDPNALLSVAHPASSVSHLAIQPSPDVPLPPPIPPMPPTAPPPTLAAPSTPASRPTSQPNAPEAPGATASTWGGAAGAGFLVMAGLAPGALVGGRAFGDLESKSLGALAPSVRLGLIAAENGAFTTPVARFLLLTTRVDACPWRIGSRELSVRPCLSGGLGALRATGIDVAHPTTRVDVWADVGALARGRWYPIGGRFFVELEGGILFPLNRPKFVFQAPPSPPNSPPVNTPVYTPSPIAATGSLSGGMRFW